MKSYKLDHFSELSLDGRCIPDVMEEHQVVGRLRLVDHVNAEWDQFNWIKMRFFLILVPQNDIFDCNIIA